MIRFHFGECAEICTDKRIVKKENKAKIKIINSQKNEIMIVKVDDCLQIDGRRCDWLFIITEKNHAFFVELKGKDIKTGLQQLGNSIDKIENNDTFLTKKFDKKYCYLILNNFSPVSSTALQNLKLKFSRKYKIIPEIKKTKNAEIKVS